MSWESPIASRQNLRLGMTDMKLGEILVRKRLLSQSQLDCFIILQSSTHQKLGELLVDHGVIDLQSLEQALEEQSWRSHGFWVID